MEYWLWMILALFSAGLAFVSVGKVLTDIYDTDLSDMFLLIISFGANIIMAINTIAGQDFIEANGSVDVYYGNAWLWAVFFGMALLSMGFFFVVLLAQIRAWHQRRGY